MIVAAWWVWLAAVVFAVIFVVDLIAIEWRPG
jgi:hypothetical protein